MSLADTYVAALQHDLVDTGSATLVGVVRRPTGWFAAEVDENRPALGPPVALLDDAKERAAALEAAGHGDAAAHNQAWADVDFEARYREHLADGAAADAVASLAARLRDGEDLVLVCFEDTDAKRCHRTILAAELRDRLA